MNLRPAFFVAVAGLVLNSLGCYGAWATSAEARKCCGSLDCSSGKQKDPCCKTSVSGFTQSLHVQKKITVQPQPVSMPAEAIATPSFEVPRTSGHPGPCRADMNGPPECVQRPNLPLLI